MKQDFQLWSQLWRQCHGFKSLSDCITIAIVAASIIFVILCNTKVCALTTTAIVNYNLKPFPIRKYYSWKKYILKCLFSFFEKQKVTSKWYKWFEFPLLNHNTFQSWFKTFWLRFVNVRTLLLLFYIKIIWDID